MSKEIAIEIKGLSKHFCLPTEKSSSIKQTFINWTKGVKGYKEQKVLRNISFTVEKGDFFGVVGRNGSGKSTLLKLISGIYRPDGGAISINGSLVSFIELGVGFNAELTGHDNVYLNGALLGFSAKEIDDMYDEIVAFAELEEFMDQKLKNYSSGMQVRLAFSCAIRAKSDILVLDEVLAVGDEAFQRKCKDFFEAVRRDQNKTIVLVTHSMSDVRAYCNKAILIDNGRVLINGSPDDVANEYSLKNLEALGANKDDSGTKQSDVIGVDDFKVKLLSPKRINQNETISIEVSFRTKQDEHCFVAAVLQDIDRYVPIIIRDSKIIEAKAGKMQRIRASFDLPIINDSNIKIAINIRNKKREVLAYYPDHLSPVIALHRNDYPKHRITDSILYDYGKWNSEK